MVESVASADVQNELGGPPRRMETGRPGRRARVDGLIVGFAALVLFALWQGGRSTSPSPSVAPSAGTAGSDPVVALIDANGALATVDLNGRSVTLDAEPGTSFGFPAWSPDGSRIAAVVAGADGSSISIFGAHPTDSGPSPAAPVVVYRSADVPPFYLYWTPDG
ncbi:MAG TPA: hypothetical protein VHM48_09800, partial [Candidatus Limnocylindrales bacterium]|nr:hypothetical protein [Candidatus Limnocylindrales bacterium]